MRFLQLSMRRWYSYNWACGKEIHIIEHAPKRFWQLSILRMRSWRLPTRPMLTGSGKSRWSSSTCLTSVSKLSSYSRKASYNTVSPHWRDENKFGHFRIRRSLQIFIQVSLSVTHMVKLDKKQWHKISTAKYCNKCLLTYVPPCLLMRIIIKRIRITDFRILSIRIVILFYNEKQLYYGIWQIVFTFSKSHLPIFQDLFNFTFRQKLYK